MMMAMAIELLDVIAKETVWEEFSELANSLINQAFAFTMFAFWISFLDDAAEAVQHFANRAKEIVQNSPNADAGRQWTRNMSEFRNDAIDKAHAVPGGSRLPAPVLAKVVGVHCTLGKAQAKSIFPEHHHSPQRMSQPRWARPRAHKCHMCIHCLSACRCTVVVSRRWVQAGNDGPQ